MDKQHLPSRIAAVMITTVVVFVFTAGATIGWMGRALDLQARDHVTAQVEGARSNLLAQTRLLMLDYAKWEAAIPRIQSRDMAWIRDNIGASAVAGISFQLAALWGGALPRDISWSVGEGIDPQSGAVDPALLGHIETHLRRIPLNLYRGTEFFVWHNGSLHVIGAARIEPDAPAAVADLVSRDRTTPRILLGQQITPEVLNGIAESLRIEGLSLVRHAPSDRSALALPGADGRPVAFLAWTLPVPGTGMIRQMAPFLLAEIVLMAGLAGFGIILLRRGAGQLIQDERTAIEAARTDPLTGLPNRAALFAALGRPSRAGERAVLFLDVNGFKEINDSLGHAAGDQVIVNLARRLDQLRPPAALLSRIGGDEFVFLIAGPGVEAQLPALTERIQWAFEAPFEILGREMVVGCSLGHAIQRQDETSGEELLREADLSMYKEKRHGRTRPVRPAPDAALTATWDDWLIERELRGALNRLGELFLLYQPILGQDRRLVRAKAVVRWTSPSLGSVPPDIFLPLADRAGLMPELGRHLIRLACADLAHHPDLGISLDVSLSQATEPGFVPDLLEEVGRWHIDFGRIQLELPEPYLQEHRSRAAKLVGDLRDAGIAMALTQVVPGRSPLGSLTRIGFEAIRLIRPPVTESARDAEHRNHLGVTILMAHSAGLRVICDRVDTSEEADALQALGCDLLQGDAFAPPHHIEVLIERWLGRPALCAASA